MKFTFASMFLSAAATLVASQPDFMRVEPRIWLDGMASNERPPISCQNSGDLRNEIDPSRAVVTGMRCSGTDCSNIELQCADDGDLRRDVDRRFYDTVEFRENRRIEHSYWTPFFSEEQDATICADDYFMTGVMCDDSRCDNLSIECTRTTGRTRSDCRYARTEQNTPLILGSDGTFEARTFLGFDTQLLIAGIDCSDGREGGQCSNAPASRIGCATNRGPYCRRKSLYVCVANFSEEDPVALYEDNNPIDNRFTKVTTDGREPATCAEGFTLSRALVNTFLCTGRYCDDIQLGCHQHAQSREDDKLTEVVWTRSFSEETRVTLPNGSLDAPGRVYCPADYFMTGVQCDGSYCDALSMQCTHVEGRRVLEGSCEWTTSLSEEDGGRLFLGSSNYPNKFIRGMDCDGSYCDNKRFYVCTPEYF